MRALICPKCGTFDTEGNIMYLHTHEYNLYAFDFEEIKETLVDSNQAESYCECTACNSVFDGFSLYDFFIEFKEDENEVKIMNCSFYWETHLDLLAKHFKNKFPNKQIMISI